MEEKLDQEERVAVLAITLFETHLLGGGDLHPIDAARAISCAEVLLGIKDPEEDSDDTFCSSVTMTSSNAHQVVLLKKDTQEPATGNRCKKCNRHVRGNKGSLAAHLKSCKKDKK